MTIREAIKFGAEELELYDIELAQLESEVLLAYALNISRESLYLDLDLEIDVSDFNSLIKRRIKNEPIAYITGHKEFYGREFIVNSSVLIPRPDTETLIEETIKIAKEIKNEPINIIDIGCGSGNISLTLSLEINNSSIIGIDLSQKALDISNKNKELLKCDDVAFIKSNLLSEVDLDAVDIIVANLPYVPETERHNMQDDILKYEPLSAVFGGRDGLDLYRKLIDQLLIKEIQFSAILFEIHPTQYEELEYYFKERFSDYETNVVKDLAGRDRVFVACKQAT